jgi:hypothetical protein
MAKAPGDRYQSCMAFADALREACELGAGDAEAAGRPAAAGWQPTEMAHVAGQAPPTAWPGPAAAAPPTAWPSDPQPASYQPGQTDPLPGALPSYPAGPQPGQHPSWPEAPPSRYVVPPPAPSRYTADAVAPRRRRSWMGALLIVAVILLLGMAGALFALLRGHSSSTTPPASTSSAASSPANKTSSAPPTTSPPVNPAAGPRATVQAYFAAINAHDYRTAWNLGGSNTGQSYEQFVQGFNGTQRDTLTIQSVSGNVVTAGLSALQADGTVKIFQGTYTVSNGVITAFHVRQTS